MQPITPDLIDIVGKRGLGAKMLDDGTLRYVVFLTPVRMAPIIRTARESLTATVARQGMAFDVVINGNYFDASSWVRGKAAMGYADDPSSTTIQGTIVADGKVVAGDSRPERFYLAEVKSLMTLTPKEDKPRKSRQPPPPPPPPPFDFQIGRGNPPTAPDMVAAVGNLGPMIVHGLPYGVGNQYRAPATGPATGDPGPALSGQLTQRNDNTFASVEQRDDRTGKTIVAWHSAAHALLIGVEKDHDQNRPGETYTRLTHLLVAAGFSDAVFFDGSDSAMMWYKGRMVVAPAEYKDNTMTVAVGFAALPPPPPPPPSKPPTPPKPRAKNP